MVRLVLGVARLGETDLRGWWSCHGLDEVGYYVSMCTTSSSTSAAVTRSLAERKSCPSEPV